MKLYLIGKRTNINATAEYNVTTGTFIVLAGSTVSESIAHSDKFRGAKSIEKHRAGNVVGVTVMKDVVFKSASTAANFVTGTSTNGLVVWKDAAGKTLKELLADMEK